MKVTPYNYTKSAPTTDLPKYDTPLTLSDLKAVTRAFGGAFTVSDMFDLAASADKKMIEDAGYRWSA